MLLPEHPILRGPVPEGPSPRRTFVTELSAPVGLTEALPGLVAGAVDAPRVRDAFVTVQALPAILAPGDRQHTFL